MAREFAEQFYNSTAWKRTRAAYAKSVGGLCEECLKHGQYRPGEIVHHRIHITPENINNPDVVLAWENLQLLCRECHAAVHMKRERRYRIDELGRIITPPR